MYVLNGVGWFKVADTIDAYLLSTVKSHDTETPLTHPEQGFMVSDYAIIPDIINIFFYIGCVMTADIKDKSLV
jgi:hypothetical protein